MCACTNLLGWGLHAAWAADRVVLLLLWLPCGCHVQVIVAESYGGNDEPVDSLVASLVGVGVEVRQYYRHQKPCTACMSRRPLDPARCLKCWLGSGCVRPHTVYVG